MVYFYLTIYFSGKGIQMNEWDFEKQYRSMIQRLGGTMLFFLMITNVLGMVGMGLSMLWEEYLTEGAASLVSSVTDGVVYILSFLLPVAFFRILSKGKMSEPMRLEPRLPRATFAYIFAGMAVILAAAYLNHYMIAFTNYDEFAAENLWVDTYETPQAIVMTFITMAIIPGFVEEFLFRGLVQSNLRPFGKGVAIVGSAVLFGLMHQNIQQIFYATVAGLVLGYLYEVTGSIWCGILLHLMNNGFSVFESAIMARFEGVFAERVCTLAEGAIFGIGAICLVFLICHRQKDISFADGVFEKQLPLLAVEERYPLPAHRKVRLFFSPLMLAFVILCVLTMIAIFVVALIQYGF